MTRAAGGESGGAGLLHEGEAHPALCYTLRALCYHCDHSAAKCEHSAITANTLLYTATSLTTPRMRYGKNALLDEQSAARCEDSATTPLEPREADART